MAEQSDVSGKQRIGAPRADFLLHIRKRGGIRRVICEHVSLWRYKLAIQRVRFLRAFWAKRHKRYLHRSGNRNGVGRDQPGGGRDCSVL